jgi:hypothetical protein
MRSITVTPQNMRECRWCQPQIGAAPDTEDSVLDALWECVRIPGGERPVTEAECAGCEEWEADYSF